MDTNYEEMIILPDSQIEKMVAVSDFMLRRPSVTVADIRERFNLSRESYNMIFDLTMPLFRKQSSTSYWRTKYSMLKEAIRVLINTMRSFIKNPHSEGELRESLKGFIKDLEQITQDTDIGKLNTRMQLEFEDHEDIA